MSRSDASDDARENAEAEPLDDGVLGTLSDATRDILDPDPEGDGTDDDRSGVEVPQDGDPGR